MAKPATVPLWATDATLTSGLLSGSAVISEPTLGYKQQGNVPGRIIPARFFNWWQNLVYQWILYLQSGLFEGGVYSVSGDVGTFGEFKYCSALGVAQKNAKVVAVPLTSGRPGSGTWFSEFSLGLWSVRVTTATGAETYFVEVKPPVGSEVTGFTLGLQSTGTDAELDVIQVTRTTSTGLNVATSKGTDVTYSAGKLSVGFSAVTVTDEITFVVKLTTSTSGAGEYLRWLYMSINDAGPTNG